jgi:hypothetical protein
MKGRISNLAAFASYLALRTSMALVFGEQTLVRTIRKENVRTVVIRTVPGPHTPPGAVDYMRFLLD